MAAAADRRVRWAEALAIAVVLHGSLVGLLHAARAVFGWDERPGVLP